MNPTAADPMLRLRLQRPIISDHVTWRAAAVTVRRPHGRGDRRPECVHVDIYAQAPWQREAGSEEPNAFAATTGTDEATYLRERPGVSALVLEDGARLPHT
jgi:hypothetical protein